ncbi:VOC family protein [Glycomyces endophyticus]|uniref:VOC family protein n=1 Tax=Glycomyces endophyticus TaxID=480996 RepID=A0ABN2H059_9ACTN
MSVHVTPHLNFRGEAREALEFYRSVFGGELAVTTYGEMGSTDPAEAGLVVWGQVAAPNGFRVMAYDAPAARPWSRGEDPFFVSVRGTGAEELAGLWAGLAEGGTVVQPFGPSAWAAAYGMVRDRFGITWVLDVLG